MLFLAFRLLLAESGPRASREQQHRDQQWDKEGGGQSLRGNETFAFSSSAGLCWFKMTVKLWKNLKYRQCWIIVMKEIMHSSILFIIFFCFLQTFFNLESLMPL